MQAASPRHPWKAIAVVLLVFAVVHGARAHADLRGHDIARIHVVHAGHDCEDLCEHLCEHPVIDFEDDPDDDVILNVFDDDAWS